MKSFYLTLLAALLVGVILGIVICERKARAGERPEPTNVRVVNIPGHGIRMSWEQHSDATAFYVTARTPDGVMRTIHYSPFGYPGQQSVDYTGPVDGLVFFLVEFHQEGLDTTTYGPYGPFVPEPSNPVYIPIVLGFV